MDNSVQAQSPPPAQLDVEAPRQLPSLPIEILQRIIQLALPRLSFKTFRERYDILLNCCRVNKLWAALAQRELYRHVWLNHEVAGDAFLRSHSAPLAERMESLRLNEEHKSPGVKTAAMNSLVDMLPGPRELHLITKPGGSGDFLVLDLGALSKRCRELEVLVMDYCKFDPDPAHAALQLPALRHLALSYLYIASDFASILAKADLPQLESLVLVLGNQVLRDEMGTLTAALARHAPRLKVFTLSFIDDEDQYPLSDSFWSSLTALEALTLDHSYDIRSVLPHLTPTLRRLQIRPPFLRSDSPLTFEYLSKALKVSAPCLQFVKEIILPPAELSPQESPNGSPSATICEGRIELETICQQLGLEVITVPSFRNEDFMDHLENALTF